MWINESIEGKGTKKGREEEEEEKEEEEEEKEEEEKDKEEEEEEEGLSSSPFSPNICFDLLSSVVAVLDDLRSFLSFLLLSYTCHVT